MHTCSFTCAHTHRVNIACSWTHSHMCMYFSDVHVHTLSLSLRSSDPARNTHTQTHIHYKVHYNTNNSNKKLQLKLFICRHFQIQNFINQFLGFSVWENIDPIFFFFFPPSDIRSWVLNRFRLYLLIFGFLHTSSLTILGSSLRTKY